MITLNSIIRSNSLTLAVFLALCLCHTSLHAQFNPQHIRAVDTRATGNNDGTSWANAYNFLQDALTFASIPQNGITEIWVAKGEYVPDRDSSNPVGSENREATFLLNFNNIILLGGFIGTEDVPIHRNPDLNVTVLSGILGSGVHSVCGDAAAGSCNIDNGTLGCDDTDCCAMVCAVDPDCCEVSWDQACAELAMLTCGICGETGAGDCFVENETPGCDDADCCALVCELDLFCCDTQWDSVCAGIAECLCTPRTLPRAFHVVTVNGVDDSVRIDGFTITQGQADSSGINSLGGGILINDAGPAVVRCIFTKNSAPGHGGGAMQIGGNSHPLVFNCTMTENDGVLGGAIHLDPAPASATLVNCLISDNLAHRAGGAIDARSGFPAILKLINCTVADNTAQSTAGGIWVAGSIDVTITNSIFWGNFPDQIDGTATITYSDIQGGWEGANNIDENPLFIEAANGDYRLQLGSPCFDGGDPDDKVIPIDTFDVDQDKDETERTPDLDLLDRIINLSVDMGAYEIQCPWDLDNSGSVDTNDLLALFAQWETDGSADFDSNGIVNTADLLILFANWGSCK